MDFINIGPIGPGEQFTTGIEPNRYFLRDRDTTQTIPGGFTTGSVPFSNSAGKLTENNAQFFWDNTNNRLGIGTTTPAAKLHIYPNANTTVGLVVQGDNNISANIQDWQNSAGTILLSVNSAGNINRPSGAGTDLKIIQANTSFNTIFQNGNSETFRTNSSYALDARTSALPIRLGNTKSLVGRNAANGADITIANVDASNNVRLGATGELTVVSGNVGIGTTGPNAAALLDVSSTTKGFLPPRMTTTQRDAISTPPAGLVIYNTTTNKLNVYTTAWEAVTSA